MKAEHAIAMIITELSIELANLPLGGNAGHATADAFARERTSGAAADCRAQRERKGV
jgi:hypothetical protein